MSSPPRTATARCRSSPSMARPAVRRNHLITADRAAPATAAPRPLKEPSPTKGSDVVQRTGPGVFAPSTGVWQLRDLPDARWGRPGDVPVPGDYDGDGRTDVAVWRPSTGVWLLRGLPDARWGRRGDAPVAGDYDGDGRTDVAVWRPSTGVWWLRGLPDVTLGRAGDRPVPADQDGNSTTDVGAWRPSTGEWLRRGLPAVRWGKAGDVPVRVGAPATTTAPFHAVVTAAPARRMRASWRARCPVPIRAPRPLT